MTTQDAAGVFGKLVARHKMSPALRPVLGPCVDPTRGLPILSRTPSSPTLPVHADRAGILELSCTPKTGNGLWKISYPTAVMKVNAPVSGGSCSVVEISDGVLLVNNDWVSCGSVWMLEDGGIISVAAERVFRTGFGCGDCNCAVTQ